MSNPRVLLVLTVDDATASVSGGPRKDYRVLTEMLDARTIDRSSVIASPILRALSRYVGVAVLRAWRAFQSRNDFDVILTDGEHIGLPLALLLKLARSQVACDHRASHKRA